VAVLTASGDGAVFLGEVEVSTVDRFVSEFAQWLS
jgi:hypothetical protein